jgi:hypothetical protein
MNRPLWLDKTSDLESPIWIPDKTVQSNQLIRIGANAKKKKKKKKKRYRVFSARAGIHRANGTRISIDSWPRLSFGAVDRAQAVFLHEFIENQTEDEVLSEE